MAIQNDPLFISVQEVVESFRIRLFERIEKVQQQQKECIIKNDIDSKMQEELKLNAELKAQLASLTEKCLGYDKMCSKFRSGLKISDSDQNRLDNAKEMYEIGKKLTGVRFDYSAPPNVAKGYIKCESRRVLCPFELEGGGDALWDLIQDSIGKENQPKN